MTSHEPSSSKLWNYDVFVSFRGEDTRNGFTGHLHAALQDRGFHAFIEEDNLKRGEEIQPEMLRAIEESRISIIVFSKHYAESGWLLDELVKIMECRKKLGQKVWPIFYDVHPAEVRNQQSYIAEAFQRHEERFHEERVKQWREALTDAANLSGYYLNNGNEAKLIRRIVQNAISSVNMANPVEWIFLVSSLCMEILSAACDQASSPNRPRYSLFGMLLAIAALLTCIWELIYKGRKKDVGWRKRGCYMLFGYAIETYGLVGGIAQCVCSIIQYVYYIRRADTPIKMSLLPALFLICLITARLSRKQMQTIDETNEHIA
ncbi:disease resistance protein RPV1 [Pyrus x bretschneideri]|uniref:disease resistance protein RPV1 n=1 Tax=Pyrus x bretschneideri TaxID=225117 RepID=UPI00051198F9|nr:disease resistance protein RPV1 [Pyrus x bretschneideri]